MFIAAACIAAVIGLMLAGGGLRTRPEKSNVPGTSQVGPADSDRASAAQPANPADEETENSIARQSPRHAVGEVEKNRLQQEQRKLESRRQQLQSQLGSLLRYEDAQLVVYAAGLDLPANTVREIHPKYMEAERHLADLKIAGLGDPHPTVKAQKEKFDELKRELDEGVVKLRESLTAQLKLLEDSPPQAKD